MEYPIPVMKSQRYTIDDIFEKGLLLLIPFHIFSHESHFHHYNQNPAERKRLTEEYQYIMETLEELTQAKQIDEYTKCTLIDMSKKVLAHIAKNYKNVREHPTGIPLCTKTCTDQGFNEPEDIFPSDIGEESTHFTAVQVGNRLNIKGFCIKI